MMNLTRGEEFIVELSLDTDPEALESLALSIVQDGKAVLRREKQDAVFDADAVRAYFAFTEAETGRLRAGVPAFARARALLPGGAAMCSGTEEICVLDGFGTEEEGSWS